MEDAEFNLVIQEFVSKEFFRSLDTLKSLIEGKLDDNPRVITERIRPDVCALAKDRKDVEVIFKLLKIAASYLAITPSVKQTFKQRKSWRIAQSFINQALQNLTKENNQ